MKEDISPAAPTTAPNSSLGIKAGPIFIGKRNKDKNGKTGQGSQRPPMDTQIIMAGDTLKGELVEFSSNDRFRVHKDFEDHYPEIKGRVLKADTQPYSHKSGLAVNVSSVTGVGHVHHVPLHHLERMHLEHLSKSASAGTFIHDFVHSKNSKFAGKSKKERIKMALGAWYHKESFVVGQRVSTGKSTGIVQKIDNGQATVTGDEPVFNPDDQSFSYQEWNGPVAKLRAEDVVTSMKDIDYLLIEAGKKSKSSEKMKRKYLGKTRGTTATGKKAHEVVIDPIIKIDPKDSMTAMNRKQALAAPDRGL